MSGFRWRLFLDDERTPIEGESWVLPYHVNEYPIDNIWIVARSFEDAVNCIISYGQPYYISFDHDLGESSKTGMDFAKWLVDYILDNLQLLPKDFDFYVHSQNPIGAANIRSYMNQYLSTVK